MYCALFIVSFAQFLDVVDFILLGLCFVFVFVFVYFFIFLLSSTTSFFLSILHRFG